MELSSRLIMEFSTVKNRAEIIVSGPDAAPFLQGLVTNNLDRLKHNNLLYACLLTPQGKFLYDFFLRASGDDIILDCEGSERAETLYKKLSMYKLHSDVFLTLHKNAHIYVSFEAGEKAYKDPRHEKMGYRIYNQIEGTEIPIDQWEENRIHLCVPDGSCDMLVEKSTLLESRIDKLNGIDFKKGCYMGQELTARMHYRGLAKKHLYAIEFEGPAPDFGENITLDDKVIGDMRSSRGNIGIALLKDEAIESPALPFMILS